MKDRLPQIIPSLSGVLLAACLVLPLQAEELTAPAGNDLTRAMAMQRQADQMEQQAEQLLAEEELVCAKKFLVNDCRNAAKQRYLKTVRESRRLNAEGHSLEQQIRRVEREQRRQQLEADTQRQAQELPQRQTDRTAAQSLSEAERAKRLADKEQQALEGAQKSAERLEKQRQKQADHARKLMEKSDAKTNTSSPAEARPQP